MEALNEAEICALILKCKEGDESAFERLLDAYTPMIRSQLFSMELDESAFTDAVHAFYRATLSYDVGQSDVTFGLYAKICVTNRLTDVLRRERQTLPVVPLDDNTVAMADGTLSRLVHAEERAEFRRRARETLSDFEYRVLLRWLRGDKTSQIATEMSATPKSVDNAKARILKKLRKTL